MEERKKYLIAVAGGRGLRMGGDVPKQFIRIGGRAVLHRTIDRFVAACPDIHVLTVMNADFIDMWKEYCLASDMVVPQGMVRGGMTRFHSVQNALGRIPDGAVVAVHDGVRPFVPEELIRRMFAMSETAPALVPVVPCVDTMRALGREKGEDGTEVLKSLGVPVDRSVLYSVQTPQVFHSEVLKAAYSLPYDTSFTDDASVVERSGVPLTFVEGNRLNIKLTTREDLALAEALLRCAQQSV